jgi:hypothetical protein
MKCKINVGECARWGVKILERSTSLTKVTLEERMGGRTMRVFTGRGPCCLRRSSPTVYKLEPGRGDTWSVMQRPSISSSTQLDNSYLRQSKRKRKKRNKKKKKKRKEKKEKKGKKEDAVRPLCTSWSRGGVTRGP